jgi:hypothetical protein
VQHLSLKSRADIEGLAHAVKLYNEFFSHG